MPTGMHSSWRALSSETFHIAGFIFRALRNYPRIGYWGQNIGVRSCLLPPAHARDLVVRAICLRACTHHGARYPAKPSTSPASCSVHCVTTLPHRCHHRLAAAFFKLDDGRCPRGLVHNPRRRHVHDAQAAGRDVTPVFRSHPANERTGGSWLSPSRDSCAAR